MTDKTYDYEETIYQLIKRQSDDEGIKFSIVNDIVGDTAIICLAEGRKRAIDEMIGKVKEMDLDFKKECLKKYILEQLEQMKGAK